VPIIIILLCLALMLFQDAKYRKIHVIFPVTIFAVSIFMVKNKMVGYGIYNVLFLAVTFVFLIIYISLKQRAFINPFKNYFGLGDLLFYISVTPLFLIHNYILFFIFSLLFSIVIHYLFIKLSDNKTIPLAGYASLFLIIIILKDSLTHYPPFTLI